MGSLEFLPKSWRNYGLTQMTGEQVSDITSDDPLTRMIQTATTYYSSEVPPPKGLTAEELAEFNLPVYVALAENSLITGHEAAENAALLPKATVKIWPDTTHSLPMEVASELAVELDKFWNENS